MSRAFVSERDGSFCTERMQDCVWADENGKCPFSRCKREAELTKPAAEANRQDSGAEQKRGEGER
ncbi:MAG: hypothetical protein ABFC73_14865 [Clostridiaceae bacterium]